MHQPNGRSTTHLHEGLAVSEFAEETLLPDCGWTSLCTCPRLGGEGADDIFWVDRTRGLLGRCVFADVRPEELEAADGAGPLPSHAPTTETVLLRGLQRPREIAASPDGSRVFFIEEGDGARPDGALRMYDVASGESYQLLRYLASPRGLCVTQTQEIVLIEDAAREPRVICLSCEVIWSLVSGAMRDLSSAKRVLLSLPERDPRALADSPDALAAGRTFGRAEGTAVLRDGTLLVAMRDHQTSAGADGADHRTIPGVEQIGGVIWAFAPLSVQPPLRYHAASGMVCWASLPVLRSVTLSPHGSLFFAGCGTATNGLATAVGMMQSRRAPPTRLVHGFATCVAVDRERNVFFCTARRAGALRALWASGTPRWRRRLIQLARRTPLPMSPRMAARTGGKAGAPGAAVRSGGPLNLDTVPLADDALTKHPARPTPGARSRFATDLAAELGRDLAQQARAGNAVGAGASLLWPEGDSGDSVDDPEGVRVRVVLRCRPLLLEEEQNEHISALSCTSNDVTADVSLAQSDARAAAAQTMSSKRTFTFQRVYNESAGQQLVFMEVVAPLVQRALAGYHCAVFAYGQTGSGKTVRPTALPHARAPALGALVYALGSARCSTRWKVGSIARTLSSQA